MEDSSQFKIWLSETLDKMEVDSEVYTDYCAGIMESEESSIEENAKTTVELLSSLTDDASPDFEHVLIEQWMKSQNRGGGGGGGGGDHDVKKVEKEESDDIVSKTLRESRASKRKEAIETSKLERKRLVEELGLDDYMYVVGEDVLGDIESEKTAQSISAENANRRRVEQERRKKREIQKKKSKAKKERDKADLARDKARKEKRLAEARKRAAKGERRKKR
jgi:hypothetical protein